jgi:hypothetical protein
MSPERTSVYDDHLSIVASSRYHFTTHHHSVDCRDFLPAYDRTVFATKNLRPLLRRRSQPGTTLRASTVRPIYKAPQLGSQDLALRPPYPVSPLLFQLLCLYENTKKLMVEAVHASLVNVLITVTAGQEGFKNMSNLPAYNAPKRAWNVIPYRNNMLLLFLFS